MKIKLAKFLGIIFFFFFLIFFVFFSLANKYYVKLNFFPFPYVLDIQLYLLILFIFALGFIFGVFFIILRKILK